MKKNSFGHGYINRDRDFETKIQNEQSYHKYINHNSCVGGTPTCTSPARPGLRICMW